MSDMPLPSDTTPEQALALVRQNRERLMQALEAQFNAAWQGLLCLPDDNPRKQPAMDALQQAWYTNGALAELIQQAEHGMAAATAAATELRDQRDTIAAELRDLVDAIRNHWQTDHPLIAPLYEEIVDEHNAAFWESLPYDMADMLGGDWNFMDADLLYSILTTHIEEVSEDGQDFGFTPAQLQAFRSSLLAMMRAFVAGIESRRGDNQ